MTQLYTPAMALSAGRFAGALIDQVRSPGGSFEELWQVGSSTAQLAVTAVRSHRGIAGPSFLLLFLLVSAEGAIGTMPVDSGLDYFGDLADGAAFVGTTLFTVLVTLTAFQKWVPRLRVGLPQPQAAPFLTSLEPAEPWWTSRTLGRRA